MHKALYPIIKELSCNITTLNGTHVIARDIQLQIRRKLKAQRVSREVSQRDVIQASTIIFKKCQEATSNMCVIKSTHNYYPEVPHRMYGKSVVDKLMQ